MTVLVNMQMSLACLLSSGELEIVSCNGGEQGCGARGKVYYSNA